MEGSRAEAERQEIQGQWRVLGPWMWQERCGETIWVPECVLELGLAGHAVGLGTGEGA